MTHLELADKVKREGRYALNVRIHLLFLLFIASFPAQCSSYFNNIS